MPYHICGACDIILVFIKSSDLEYDVPCRSRLAAAEVPLHNSGYLQENHTGVLSQLCSVFLANRGAGEATEEDFQSLVSVGFFIL